MPEMPEVETIRSQLEPLVSHRVVKEVGSHWSDKFTPALEVKGLELLTVIRKGKFLIIPTDAEVEMIIHLGMTGKLSCLDSPDLDNPHLRAWWELSDKDNLGSHLLYHDVRRFGRIRVVPAGDYRSVETLSKMGPEPFDTNLTSEVFYERLSKSTTDIKTRLLSQKPIAGIGNIYADEALWDAKINPSAKLINKGQAADLLTSIRKVLTKGLDNGGTTLKDYRDAMGGKGQNQRQLQAYGRKDEPCYRCGDILLHKKIAARSTVWCASCQK